MFYLSGIIALTLAGEEEEENFAALSEAICHLLFYAPAPGRPSPPRLFVYSFFWLPCAKSR